MRARARPEPGAQRLTRSRPSPPSRARRQKEASGQSVIGADGVVNEALRRRKARLLRDLDSALARMKDRVDALAEVTGKIQTCDEERQLKEEELKQVEAGLVSTLVSQQRALMNVISEIPLRPEDFELPREFDADSESEADEAQQLVA